MLIGYHRGQGSIVLRVKILNSSVTTGAGLTGLLFSSAGLIISTIVDNEATATTYTAAGSTTETITTLGTYAAPTATKCRFKEVDATNHKGIYEIQIADARFAVASGKSMLVSISGATNAAETDVVIPLTDIDPYDAVRAGLTGLANAVPGAAGGLFIAGTNAATTITSAGGSALTLSSTGANGSGLVVSGNGSGDGIKSTGGGTGNALELVGGGTSGDGLKITTTSGHGMNIAATGTSMHGITATGGNGGTSDGIKAVAGTGGVPIRGDITGNITGNLSGNVGGNVTGTIGGFAAGQGPRIRKNVALAAFPFLMTDSTNHAPATGLTVTATRALDSGTFAACANAVTEIGNGWYRISLAATDTNADTIAFRMTATGADDLPFTVVTNP